MQSKENEIIQAIAMVRETLENIEVSGTENCKRILIIQNNIDVLFNMLTNGEIKIVTEECKEKETTTKGTK